MIISELIKLGSQNLKKGQIHTHALDSEIILSNILKQKRETMLTSMETIVSNKDVKSFKKLIKRRLNSEPIAYILNVKEFWSKNFLVNKNALIPRPETEIMVEKIIQYFKNKKIFFLDIGTGSGCIILSLLSELRFSYGIGLDISKKAIDLALINSENQKLKNKSRFYKRSLNNIYGYKFDLIVSNPPYICNHQLKNLPRDIKRYEPKLALDGGNDGLDVIKKVIYKAKSILKKNGMLALEIGNGQHRSVSQILKRNGFRNKFLLKDYQNNIRCILSILE